jgi:hypothetical protein
MQILNDPEPWWSGLDAPLSVIDLMAAGTLPVEQAAMLWWAVERGASYFTAGGPSGAGKSTLAHALLSFLPDAARIYVVSGRDDRFDIPAGAGPTYLLISELSAHGRPFYLSGPAALHAFSLLREGRRMIGTLHAESVAQAVENVLLDEMRIPAEDVARLTFIAIIRVDGPRNARGWVERRNPDLVRRVVEIGLLVPDSTDGVRVVNLAAWNGDSGQLEAPSPSAGVAALAAWFGLAQETVETAIRARAAALQDLFTAERRAAEDVAATVRQLREKSQG